MHLLGMRGREVMLSSINPYPPSSALKPSDQTKGWAGRASVVKLHLTTFRPTQTPPFCYQFQFIPKGYLFYCHTIKRK